MQDTSSGILTAGKFVERLTDYLKRIPNIVIFENTCVN